MFPTSVQQRMFEGKKEKKAIEGQKQKDMQSGSTMSGFLGKDKNSAFVGGKDKSCELDTTGKHVYKTKPIADFFPAVTIMFADIAGFTAWSSTREPTHVFILLEALYHTFDKIAKQRRVFKVETIGDCYVAVCGLPEPNKNHAIVMARFAKDCVLNFIEITRGLETELGPGTGELGLRAGIHSGQVTAGVLRGDRARFQLFGDTMNTASRMESNGMRNRVHMSKETAEILTNSGKGNWVIPREDKVFAKGKGELDTFWLNFCSAVTRSNSLGDVVAGDMVVLTATEMPEEKAPNSESKTRNEVTTATTKDIEPREGLDTAIDSKRKRLVNWHVDILSRLLKEIAMSRRADGVAPDPADHMESLEQLTARKQGLVIDEVREIISFPSFDPVAAASARRNRPSVELGGKVIQQLGEYIRTLASLYSDNPFHNFEHASHVTMSVVKLLSCVVAPGTSLRRESLTCGASSGLYDHTFGIASDSLTHFAVVFCALIHDVYHPGVPNAQLVKEGASVAAAYNNQSVAEQNSIDIAWNLLLDERFVDFRRTIYSTESEFNRFRHVVVNAVMATDIVDRELKVLRDSRWEKAFGGGDDDEATPPTEACQSDRDRKATMVIEHLVQASDVIHTMQHWHIYQKWNKQLFQEMRLAFVEGRSEKDPAEFWYHGELGFFDFYIIPLAKKLKESGVFGVSCDEYLNYAIQNRKEWEQKGESIVAELIQESKQENI